MHIVLPMIMLSELTNFQTTLNLDRRQGKTQFGKMSWFLMNNKKKEEKRSSEIKKQYLRCVKESCKYKKLEKILGL